MSNIQFSNGNYIEVNSKKRIITKDGVVYPFKKEMKGNNISTINGKTYIDGYELVNGEWKKTFWGIFHLFF